MEEKFVENHRKRNIIKRSFLENLFKDLDAENSVKKNIFDSIMAENGNEVNAEKTKLDNTIQKLDLAKLNKKYVDFCKETGLQKEYTRTKISNYLNNFNSSNILRKNS